MDACGLAFVVSQEIVADLFPDEPRLSKSLILRNLTAQSDGMEKMNELPGPSFVVTQIWPR